MLDLDPNTLHIWTIYDHPSDFPDDFVARLFNEGKPTGTTIKGATLEAVREAMKMMTPYVLTFFPRDPSDDPVIVESWM